jgi:tight adherence protein B
VAEFVLGAVVSTAVLAAAFGLRGAAGGRGVERLREREDAGGPPAALFVPPPGALARFDDWFDRTVRDSDLRTSPSRVRVVMLLAATVPGLALYLWRGQLWLVGLAVAVGVAVPLGVVAFYHRRHRRALQNQLPDAFRMLAGSVRAGQTIEQAVAFYGERGSKPLAAEFAHCAGLMSLGMAPAVALQSTAARVGLLDFDLLVSTVGLYAQTGGNLVMLLDRLADSVRDRNQLAGQFKSSTAQARAVAIATGMAVPLLLLYYALFEPEHVEPFFAAPSGWLIVLACVAIQVVGLLWMRVILKFDS